MNHDLCMLSPINALSCGKFMKQCLIRSGNHLSIVYDALFDECLFCKTLFAVFSHDQHQAVNGYTGETKRHVELMIENVRKHLIEFTA